MTRVDPKHDGLWITTLWGKLFGEAHFYPAGWTKSICGKKRRGLTGKAVFVWDASLEKPERACATCAAFVEAQKGGTA